MNLQELEARLRSLIEVRLSRALPGARAEDLIVQGLVEAMRSNAHANDQGRGIAPNGYTFHVDSGSLADWREPQILETLLEILKVAAEEAGLQFSSQPTITVSGDPNLERGAFRWTASQRVETMDETRGMKTGTDSEDIGTIPDNAFLIIEGVKVFPLNQVVINIGRRLDNSLVLDDPRVSRDHAQLRAIKGRYVIFDLNSTGGTFVNGQRASQTVLYPGDVISLAGVSLIFGQDNPPPRPDLASTSPISEAGADRPTAILKTNPPTKKRKK